MDDRGCDERTGRRDNYQDRGKRTTGEKEGKGLQLYTMVVDRLAVAERDRGGTQRCRRRAELAVSNGERKKSMFEGKYGKYGEKVLARGDENVKKQTQLIHFSHVFLFHAPKSLYSINT